MIALWKEAPKGKQTDPRAYRALQIVSKFLKILVVVILNRIANWYNSQLQDQQQGFRLGRGTTDGIFMLKQIQQIRHQLNKQTYTLFVDLTADFDHVGSGWMFQLIYQRLIKETNRKLFELIESLYSHTTTALQQNLTDIFEIEIGVR